jgi:hypothetical protein
MQGFVVSRVGRVSSGVTTGLVVGAALVALYVGIAVAYALGWQNGGAAEWVLPITYATVAGIAPAAWYYRRYQRHELSGRAAVRSFSFVSLAIGLLVIVLTLPALGLGLL